VSFSSDCRFARVVASPNFGVRAGGQPPDCLILHYTGMPTAEAALAVLSDPAGRVSSHYLVLEDGDIFQLVAERWRAWHAGKSYWKGDTDLNSASIGIEIVHPGHDPSSGEMTPYPPRQIAAVIALCSDIVARYPIPPARILAHSDVAPGRKIDPGERFPWGELHRAGIGHFVEPAALTPGNGLQLQDADHAVRGLQEALVAYGYGLAVSSVYDEPTKIVVSAFQRHFRPALVDGLADASTLATLTNLLRTLPQPPGAQRP
jgi:N-acetylmuramoyl-L-alanine amidase